MDGRSGPGDEAPWIKNNTFAPNLLVDRLIDLPSRRWNLTALQENFVPGDVELILAKQPIVSRSDSFIWKFNKSGSLTVKSAYWLAQSLKINQMLSRSLDASFG